MERGIVEQHEIFLSGLRVGVRSSCRRTSRYLRRHWSAAGRPIVQSGPTCEMEVISDASPRIVVEGEVVWSGGVAEQLVAGFERLLYRLALARHKHEFTVFHAAAVVSGGTTFVFSGPSGAGKSSLALAAVRRGWKYFSDEFVVTDGKHVWGWPRAIRFDPREPDMECPGYLVGLDDDNDASDTESDAPTPYYPLSAEALQLDACDAHRARFVRIEHAAETKLEPLSSAAGLKHLTEAAFFDPTMSLGALVGPGRTWHATWRHPDELIDLIEAT